MSVESPRITNQAPVEPMTDATPETLPTTHPLLVINNGTRVTEADIEKMHLSNCLVQFSLRFSCRNGGSENGNGQNRDVRTYPMRHSPEGINAIVRQLNDIYDIHTTQVPHECTMEVVKIHNDDDVFFPWKPPRK